MILLSIFYEIMYEFMSKFLAIRKILEKKVCDMVEFWPEGFRLKPTPFAPDLIGLFDYIRAHRLREND